MIAVIARALVRVLPLVAPVVVGVTRPAAALPAVQDEEEAPVPDERPEVAELLDALKDHTKKRGDEDDQAIAVIDKLNMEFGQSGPKDRKDIVDGIEACFKAKRTDELEPGVPDDRLYYAAAVVLRNMGPESVDPLRDLIGHKSTKDNMRVQRELILSLGKTKDLEGVKTLLGTLKHNRAPIQAAGAEALGEFSEAPEKTRKELFEEMLKILMGQKARVDSDPADQEARDRWDTVAGPIVSSLQLLSGHDENDPAEWQRWWNKNKKADWDEPN